MRESILFFLFALLSGTVWGQLPGNRNVDQQSISFKGNYYSRHYNHTQYNGATWNYAAIQDQRGVMYFANGIGVLEFNGTRWRMIPVKNNLEVHALSMDHKGVIYVGSVDELGYLQADQSGQLRYVSLVEKIAPLYRNFTRVTSILSTPTGIYFITPGFVFQWQNNQFKIRPVEIGMHQGFTIRGKVFLRNELSGLMEYNPQGNLQLLPGGELFVDKPVTSLLVINDQKWLIGTREDGFFIYDQQRFIVWDSPANEFALKNEITCGVVLGDGNFAFGTRQNGMVITDKKGNILYYLNESQGLHSNTVTHIYQDKDQNLWLQMDNGITHVEYHSPFLVLDSRQGLKGTVYEMMISPDQSLHVATSQGIFSASFRHLSTANLIQFRAVTSGETQSLLLWRKQLLAGRNDQIVAIKDTNSVKSIVVGINGPVLNLRPFPPDSSLVLVGTMRGIVVLEKKQNHFEYKWRLKGFEYSAPNIEEYAQDYIWVSNRLNGIIRLKTNEKKDSVLEEKIYGSAQGLPGVLNQRIFKSNEKILAVTQKGIYQYNDLKDIFEPFTTTNKELADDLFVNYLKADQHLNFWIQTKDSVRGNQINILWLQSDGTYLREFVPFYKLKGLFVRDIFHVNDSNVLLATADGIIQYNPKIKVDYQTPFPALISQIESITGKDSVLFGGTFTDAKGRTLLKQPPDEIFPIPYSGNALRFSFSAAYYEEIESIQYQCMLAGLEDHWSEWTSKHEKEYTNLYEGNYTFMIRAKNIYGTESVIARYHFKILPPWYRSWWAYLSYAAMGIMLVQGFVYFNTRRLVGQKLELARLVEVRTREVVDQKKVIEKKKEEIEKKNINIESSIRYAKRIQEATLPSMLHMAHVLPKCFILYKPRDIVSGDFYWFSEIPQGNKKPKVVVAAVDCTGHGVPGAFMSLIGDSMLNHIINEAKITQPDLILNELHRRIRRELNQEFSDNRDGMDIVICVIDFEEHTLEFAGAKNPIIFFQNRRMREVKGNKVPIGGLQKEQERLFNRHTIRLDAPTMLYLFTDGYRDQFGGPENKKYSIKRFRALLANIHEKPMHEQRQLIYKEFRAWKKNGRQIDDILVWGIKLEI